MAKNDECKMEMLIEKNGCKALNIFFYYLNIYGGKFVKSREAFEEVSKNSCLDLETKHN